MVVFAALVLLALLALATWATVDLFLPVAHDIEMREIHFIEYEQDGPIYVLTSNEGYTYDLPVAAVDDLDVIDSLIYNATPVLVEKEPIGPIKKLCFVSTQIAGLVLQEEPVA